MSSYIYYPQDKTEALYNKSLEIARTRIPALLEDLQVHPVHRPSLGYWPSNNVMVGDSPSGPESLPILTGALVVPYYTSDMRLAHIGIIAKSKTGSMLFKYIGATSDGVFNLLGAKHLYESFEGKPRNVFPYLEVHARLLRALTYPTGVHLFKITQQNINNLSFTPRLRIRGNSDFIQRFEKIRNFDLTVGDTNLSVTEYNTKTFCFSECEGLDLRYTVPKLVAYCKSLPMYERDTFQREVKKILKIDLHSLYPWLFELTTLESSLFEGWVALLQSDMVLKVHKFTPSGMVLKIRHISQKEDHDLVLNPNNLSQFLSIYYGDLINFCYQTFSGLPYTYTFDTTLQVRHPRERVYNTLISLIYQAVLEVIKKK